MDELRETTLRDTGIDFYGTRILEDGYGWYFADKEVAELLHIPGIRQIYFLPFEGSA